MGDDVYGRRTPHGVRGLKCHAFAGFDVSVGSHPSRGAWIEIQTMYVRQRDWESHPSRGAWIEMRKYWGLRSGRNVAPLTGCVD